MTSRDDGPGLAYLAALIVAFVVIMVAAKLFLSVGHRHKRLWLAALVAASPQGPALPIEGGWKSEGRAGWASPYMPHQSGIARHRLMPV